VSVIVDEFNVMVVNVILVL